MVVASLIFRIDSCQGFSFWGKERVPSTQTSGLKLRTGIEKLRESFLGRGHDIVDEELLRQAWFGSESFTEKHVSICQMWYFLCHVDNDVVECGSMWFNVVCFVHGFVALQLVG